MPRRKPSPEPDAPAVDPDAGMIEEGSQAGSPSVRWDPERRLWYHLNCRRARVYDECPAGHEYDAVGNAVPVEESSNV